MARHQLRLQAARDVIDYVCGRTEPELATPVPNCPGWTVYNAAVHIGRVGVAWESMIRATPDDPDSRARGYADAESRGSGQAPAVLGSWAHAAIGALDVDDLDQPCYFSMTGGHGTVGLWGWHVASELAVHRLDVESALGHDHALTEDLALDAINYTCEYFLPAMLRATGDRLPGLRLVIRAMDSVTTLQISDDGSTATTLEGPPIEILLAIWGRPHQRVEVQGSSGVFEAWHALPGRAFQFGTWT